MVFVSTFRRALFARGAPGTYLARRPYAASVAHPAATPTLGSSPAQRGAPLGGVPPLHGRWEQSASSGALALRWYAPEPV